MKENIKLDIEILQSRIDCLQSLANSSEYRPFTDTNERLNSEVISLQVELNEEKLRNRHLESKVDILQREINALKSKLDKGLDRIPIEITQEENLNQISSKLLKSHNKDKEKLAFVNESQSPNNQQRKHNRNTYEKGSQITRSTHTDGVTQSHSSATQTYKTRENSKIDRNENSKNKVPSKSHPSSKASNWLNRLPLIDNTYPAKCEIEISQPTKGNQHERSDND